VKAKNLIGVIPRLLIAPLLIRRRPDEPPAGREHFEPTPLSASPAETTIRAVDIPVAHTPSGGYRDFPQPVLAGCDEPITPEAPDLRGVWQVHKGPLKGHIERVEQAGNRVVITAGGIIHDMYADGTLEGGVNDVHANKTSRISVAARFEDGRLNLYPGNRRVALVTRYRNGDEMVWRYGPWKNRLRRLEPIEETDQC